MTVFRSDSSEFTKRCKFRTPWKAAVNLQETGSLLSRGAARRIQVREIRPESLKNQRFVSPLKNWFDYC
jgi:hypothetical protein